MKRVLIVEDEGNIVLSLVFVLEREGIQVETVMTGAEAIEGMRRFAPDLVVLDIMLPGKNGYEICHEVQQDSELRRIPILMLTAKAQEAEKRKGLELGAVEYVTKPFRVTELLARIKSILYAEEPALRVDS